MGRPAITVCPKCDGPRVRTESRGRSAWVCRPCIAATGRRWYKDNPKRARVNEIVRRYRVDRLEAERLVEVSICEVCGGSDRIVVDHNHITGKVRGSLCNGCNTALGLIGDRPTILRKLADYLEERGHYGSLDPDSNG